MSKLHHFAIILILINYAYAKDDVNNDNELESFVDSTNQSSTINLDTKLRSALLKALSELENEEEKITKKDSIIDQINLREDMSVERAPQSSISVVTTITENIQNESTEEFNTTTTETKTSKPIVVIQKSNGIQQKPIIQYVLPQRNLLDPINDTILTSETINNYNTNESKQLRSSIKSNNNDNSIKNENKIKIKLNNNNNNRIETTTITTTTSTEESEAKVEDVQFFSAPLVAAFTVHQDERGIPKSVVPIYKPTTSTGVHQLSTSHPQRYAQQNKLEGELQQHHITLQEKQKILEQQLAKLQEQTVLQQNLLLRQQQLFQEQQLNLQKQNQNLSPNQILSNNNDVSQNNFANSIATSNNNNHFQQSLATLRNTGKNSVNSQFNTFLPTPVPSSSNFFGSFSNVKQTTVKPEARFNSNTNVVQKAISLPATVVTNSVGTTSFGRNSIGSNNIGTNSLGTTSFGGHSDGPKAFGASNVGSTSFGSNSFAANTVTSFGSNSVGPTSFSGTSIGTNPIGFESQQNNFVNRPNNNHFNNQKNSNFKLQHQTRGGSLISFQPSISFTSPQQLNHNNNNNNNQQRIREQSLSFQSPINQQLPIRNSIDFNRSPYFKVPPSVHHSLLTLVPPKTTNNDHISTIIQPSITPNLNIRHNNNNGNRVFRQEIGTGNHFGFGFNHHNHLQQQQQQQSQQRPQPNRFFRSNNDHNQFNTIPFNLQPPAINQQLNNLLYQSGIGNNGRPNEDLNIVSKILSYNVGENDNLFLGSSKTEKRVPPPSKGTLITQR